MLDGTEPEAAPSPVGDRLPSREELTLAELPASDRKQRRPRPTKPLSRQATKRAAVSVSDVPTPTSRTALAPDPRDPRDILRGTVNRLVSTIARREGTTEQAVNLALLRAGWPARNVATVEELGELRDELKARLAAAIVPAAGTAVDAALWVVSRLTADELAEFRQRLAGGTS